jgi:hypothetical protein
MLVLLFTTGVVYIGGKFTGVIHTGCKFATGVIDTNGTHCLVNFSANIKKKIETTLILFSGAWGKMIHEKKLSEKIS